MENIINKIKELDRSLSEKEKTRYQFENFKKDLHLLYLYSDTFLKNKFLSDIQKLLIPTNISENDIKPVNKLVLFLIYQEHNNGKGYKEFFEEYGDIDNFSMKFKPLMSEKDWDLLDKSIAKFNNYEKKITSGRFYIRYTELFNKNKLNKLFDYIVAYYLYVNNKLVFADSELFLEKYYSSDFYEPLKNLIDEIKIDSNHLKKLPPIWLKKVVDLRNYLYAEEMNTKGKTGYGKGFFIGNTDLNYFQLENRNNDIKSKLDDELKELLNSNWFKSLILKSLLDKDTIVMDVSDYMEKNYVLKV
ncbi:hypothetical protein [Streptococcus suis]|uniref:Uncharacterized protein n=1 Tax=Streptococcus suis TaxID=1307 RepID=A0A0Z8CE30_STRSU|nr:hypothetical protein [Streptococcus suis]NQH93588.1 hypothetical protein [Streptococcus suis]CYU23635.1 Uncharacterised protein [Streptococcus suis]